MNTLVPTWAKTELVQLVLLLVVWNCLREAVPTIVNGNGKTGHIHYVLRRSSCMVLSLRAKIRRWIIISQYDV
jgi:hypothetical protein